MEYCDLLVIRMILFLITDWDNQQTIDGLQFGQYQQFKKQIKNSCQSIEMKTKTGQFLMKQNKSKQSQTKTVDETKQNNFTLITLLKDQKQPQVNFKKEIKNKQTQGQDEDRLKIQHQDQLIAVKKQNNMMCEEIQRLNRQCSQLKMQIAQQRQIEQNNRQQEKSLKQHNASTEKLSNYNNNKSPQSSSAKNPLQQTRILKLQQKLSSLEVQNYRLIESNYLLLINFKKNMKSYKESLLKIANMLQNLQFGQASKEIYHSLAKLKGEEGHIQRKVGMIVNEEDKVKSKQKEVRDKQVQEKQTMRRQGKKKLTLASCVSSSQHFVSQTIQQQQNSIQLNLRHLPFSSFNPRQPSNSFHLISQPKSQSEKQLFISKKLFNSQIHQPQLLQPNYTLLNNSVRDKMDMTTYWQNGSFVNNKSGRQVTVHKCHGNSMQLYKMLVLQATAIEGFF